MEKWREQLVLDNQKLVYFIWYKRIKKGPAILSIEEDVIQSGMLGLVKAASTYDAQKCEKFGGHASTYIMAYMYACINRELRYLLPTVPISQIVSEADGLDFYEILQNSTMESEELFQDYEYIENFDKLTEKHKSIAYDLINGYTQTEIAKRLGISKQRVNETILQIRKILTTGEPLRGYSYKKGETAKDRMGK